MVGSIRLMYGMAINEDFWQSPTAIQWEVLLNRFPPPFVLQGIRAPVKAYL